MRTQRFSIPFSSAARALFIGAGLLASAASPAMSVSNGKIFDAQGNRVTIQGVNWFGAETETRVPHGLWIRSMTDMLDQMKSLGFNAVRVPFCPTTLQGVPTNSIDFSKNPALQGLNSLQVLDVLASELQRRSMYFLMDHHRPDCNAISELWYISGYTEQQWITDLTFVANRYKDNPFFLGMDLKNEPYGRARWGSGNATVDWNSAAERAAAAVLAVAPQSLVFVEGVGDGSFCTTVPTGIWWGGNIAPQLCRPLNIPADRLVLSPHVYGPDVFNQSYFSAPDFPNNMPAIWNSHFGDVQAQGYSVVLGETGGKYGTNDPKDKTFQDALFAYLKQRDLRDVFYWSWNPNSGDTGGILNDDWTTVRTDKVALLQNFWAGAPNPPSTTPTPTLPTPPTPTPTTPTPTPAPTPAPTDPGTGTGTTTPTPAATTSNSGYGGGSMDPLLMLFVAMGAIMRVCKRRFSGLD
jgi:endoglucanase